MIKFAFLALLAPSLALSSSSCAKPGRGLSADFTFSGRIDETAYKSIASQVAPNSSIKITSQGGNTLLAVKLGKIIRQRSISIVVSKYCLSACAQFLLPAAESIYVEQYGIVGLHSSPSAIDNELLKSGIHLSGADNSNISREEVLYYNMIGVRNDYVSSMFAFNVPLCITPADPISKRPPTVRIKFEFVVPERHNFEQWVGKEINGYWPGSLKELSEAARHSFPSTARTALTMPHTYPIREHGPLPICSISKDVQQ